MSKKGNKFLTAAATLVLVGNVLASPLSVFAAEATEKTVSEEAVEQKVESTQEVTEAKESTTAGTQTTPQVEGEDGFETPDPRISLSLLSKGKLTIKGDTELVNDGIQYDDKGDATGVLRLEYAKTAVVSANLISKTYTAIQLPEEMRELANTKEFVNNIKATTQYRNFGVNGNLHEVDADGISYDSNKNRIVIENPSWTGSLLNVVPTIYNNIEIDLGKTINETHKHIADSTDSKYHFKGRNSSSLGNLDFTIGISGSDKNIARQVLDRGYNNQDPTITFAQDKVKEIKIGSTWNDTEALKGVSAWDPEDGNITSNLKVKSNGVNINKTGTFTVVYSVKDKTGRYVEESFDIKVVDGSTSNENGQITSANYTIGDKDITGTFTGEIARGQLYINGEKVGSMGGSYENGKITHYAFGAINESNKDNVYLAALDSNNKEIDRKKVNVTSKPAESQGTIKIDADKYELGNANLTGTFTGDVKSADLYVNGVYQYSGGSFDSNPFSFYLKSGLNLKADDVVELRAYDAPYGTSPRKEVDRDSFTIAKAATQGTITPAKYTVGDAYITGTYTGDVKQADLKINGSYITSGGEFEDGKFSFYVGNKVKAGQDVKLAAFDDINPAPRKQLDEKPVQVATVATQGTVKLNPYTEGDTHITGTYTGDVEQFHLVVDDVDKTYGGEKNESNHTFSYYVGGSTIKAGSKVTIQAYDSTVFANMNYLDEDTVVAKSAVDTNGEFTSVEFDGKNHIVGTYTGTAMKVAYITVNGEWLPGATGPTWGGDFESKPGEFDYYVPSNTLQKGDVVRIYAYTQGEVGHHFVNSKEFTVR
ncbi:lipoprotein [Listeria fleischmannii 1991]|uniref:Uncharacterized protein n=2 Tax=Listeria fleischmannii TaxID=1069827 RepID=A0A2X3J8C0_9LIST|nr:immunoglobulin-like domain-containing protein [Listeria fleischmannii]EMG27662.1 F5/8 type C domain-containing protein [Listeria fleischmannii subsp. fleischmannii LU2006-1]KMT60349.1 lipoprotein [Listeria fleischmannii 1991]SQC70450.1 Uncharacterised protein [Listeria fleischmannii subsp. fleischmannii]